MKILYNFFLFLKMLLFYLILIICYKYSTDIFYVLGRYINGWRYFGSYKYNDIFNCIYRSIGSMEFHGVHGTFFGSSHGTWVPVSSMEPISRKHAILHENLCNRWYYFMCSSFKVRRPRLLVTIICQSKLND